MRNAMRVVFWGLVSILLVAILITALAGTGQAAPPAQAVSQGQALFQQQCIACHTIGGGKLVGPDLQGVTTRRTTDWLTRWLQDPPGMVAQKDPIATQLVQQYQSQMPNLGLTAAQITALLDYLANPAPVSTGQAAAAPVQPVAIIPGDPARGRAIFTGGVGLANGGPACLGCHTVSGIGELGGGALGPDLTGAFVKYGEQGLANFLNTYPLPTMKAVWTAIPLGPQEQADLRVFLQQAGAGPPPQDLSLPLAGIGIVSAAALLALAQIYWRKRLLGVRRPLLRRALREGGTARMTLHG